MVIFLNSVIGGFGWVDLVWSTISTLRLQVSDYGQLSDYAVRLQLYRTISEIKAVDAPITFKEIVMNMIMLHVSWLFK